MALGVPEFRAALVTLGKALDGDVGKLVGALVRLDIAAALRYVTDAYPEVVTPYIAAAGDLTASWYEDLPAAVGAKAFIATSADLPPVEQLAASGRWAMLQRDPGRALQGSGERAVFRVQRETVLVNVKSEGVRWARHARPEACDFCKDQATHGALDPADEQALRSHDFCHCLAVPDRYHRG